MFQKSLTTAVIIVSVLSLTACESGPDASIDTAGGSISGSGVNRSTNNQTGEIQLDENETTPAKEYSEADTAAYQGALQLKDVSFCEKILDGEYKNMCVTDINDKKILEQALETMDAVLCDNLSTEDKTLACVIKVDVLKAEQKRAVELLQKDTEQSALSQSIVTAGDHTRCTELADPNQREACEMNILLNKAFAESDITYCDKMSTDEGKSACRSNYDESAPSL